MAYNIVRFYQRGGHRIITTGLTKEEARAHCSNPETSSKGTSAAARRITKRNGPWFDGYEED